jgi:hypothetical protein
MNVDASPGRHFGEPTTPLVMTARTRKALDHVAHELAGTSADGALDLLRAVKRAEVVNSDTICVRCTDAALALIERELPEIATLWPAAFGLVHAMPVPATDEWTPALADLAAHARSGGVVLDVKTGRVMVRLADGTMLVVSGEALELRHVPAPPASAQVLPLVGGA